MSVRLPQDDAREAVLAALGFDPAIGWSVTLAMHPHGAQLRAERPLTPADLRRIAATLADLPHEPNPPGA
jgi:hypothetical protein